MPDVFEIIIERKELTKFKTGPFETAFGLTTEKYLFWKNQPIALVSALEEYHNQFDNDFSDGILLLFNLLHTSDSEINIDHVKEFISEIKKALVIYELDCDQFEFKHLEATEYEIDALLNKSLDPTHHNFNAFTLRK